MKITNKGLKWELLNSLWILVAFIPLLNFLAFVYIGSSAKQRKWRIAGIIYLLLTITTFSLIDFAGNVYILTMSVSLFAPPVHAFMVRKEYLLRREMIVNNMPSETDALRRKILNEKKIVKTKPSLFKKQKTTVTPKTDTENKPVPSSETVLPPLIDLNTCSEQQFADLPGVGAALAKKAVQMRAQSGGFHSPEDFNMKLNLMPHLAVQIEKLAYTSEPASAAKHEPGGRVLDL